MVPKACEGPLILPDVLHVPELDGPLFPVKAALRRGLSAHFWPSSRPGGAYRIALIQNGRTVLTAGPRGDLYYLYERSTLMAAARMATANARELDVARESHRSLGHEAFGTCADLCHAGMLRDDVTPAAFVQARMESVCEPCVLGKLRRGSHPSRRPQQIRVLGRVHMYLCDLPHGYFRTVTDEATRFCTVFLVQRKSDTEAAVRQILAWSETQTGQRVQKVRHDRGEEYMGGSLRQFFGERGVQMEPTSAHAPEANGIAERHNLRLLDMARPMLADSGDARHGLEPLEERFAGDPIMYANDLHNAMPASGAQVGSYG
jgi:transposase InsO family protein